MTEQIEQILLIDLENCQGHVDCLMDDLQQFSRVILCYAKTNAKIPLDWLTALSHVIQQGRLEILKMSQVGKDSADFGLSFLAGRLSVQLSRPSHFIILSDDKALDYVINLLTTYGHSAIRKSGKVLITPLTENKPALDSESAVKKESKTSAEQRQFIYNYCQRLLNSGKTGNFPVTKSALLKSIYSFSSQDQALSDKTLQYLISSNAFKVKNKESIQVNLPKLETLAKMVT